ncbi:MAG TPA: thymidylate synthase [Mucilaginibacter sp.]|nr:thymidylate synthase [Mucilaginibacter sp.]
MQHREFAGINSFLTGMSKILLKESVVRKTRGFTCHEFPYPLVIKIKNPLSRIVTIPERQWNYILPYVESLWIASGRNDMRMVGHYVKKLYDFSDDQETMRAGYGPRLRWFSGISDDYNTGYNKSIPQNAKTTFEVDQFKFIEQTFKNDPCTRQAIVSLGDPAKDCFDQDHNLKRTKDFPCTRDIQFLRNNNKLDVIVHMRSNDFIWGATGVNIFNFTFMQEYFAQILGLEIGSYYHIVNNFHYYENFMEKLEILASVENVKDEAYLYKKSFNNLKEFDEKVAALENYEKLLRDTKTSLLEDFNDDFFNDWAKVLYSFHHSKMKINFENPLLKLVSERKIDSKTIKENRTQFDNTFNNQGSLSDGISWQNYI